MNVNDVIKYPILTEKTYQLMEQSVYTFAVARRASKLEIKAAVEFIFNVRVTSVNTFNVPRQAKKIGRYHGFKAAYKKAIVTLATGSQIQIFPEEGIATDPALKAEAQAAAQQRNQAAQVEAKVAQKLAAKGRKAKATAVPASEVASQPAAPRRAARTTKSNKTPQQD